MSATPTPPRRVTGAMGRIRTAPTAALGDQEIAALRDLFDAVWPNPADRFDDDDWEHAIGGLHFLLERDGHVIAHASVVERELHTGSHRLRTGYVEAVATNPEQQGRGYGSAVMREVGAYVDRTFRLGALGGDPNFYGRLGWQVWLGPTYVRTAKGVVRTEADDGSVLVRRTPTTPRLDLGDPISCEWRRGDVW